MKIDIDNWIKLLPAYTWIIVSFLLLLFELPPLVYLKSNYFILTDRDFIISLIFFVGSIIFWYIITKKSKIFLNKSNSEKLFTYWSVLYLTILPSIVYMGLTEGHMLAGLVIFLYLTYGVMLFLCVFLVSVFFNSVITKKKHFKIPLFYIMVFLCILLISFIFYSIVNEILIKSTYSQTIQVITVEN